MLVQLIARGDTHKTAAKSLEVVTTVAAVVDVVAATSVVVHSYMMMLFRLLLFPGML